jgi:DNA polymerase-3 subunit delta
MAVRPEQLAALLERSLAPVYLIANEPGQDSAAMSLFSSRKIVDIRLPTGKPGRDGAKYLTERATQPDPDQLLLVSCAQWDKASRKSKWAATLEKAGVLVQIWPVNPRELPGWIRRRMRQAGLEPEAEALALLAELSEGNLLAAQQEIEKLVLLGRSRKVTAADVSRAVADSSRFDAFRLVECMLSGRLGDCLRVASGLQRTNVPIQAVTGAIYRELSLADIARSAIRGGENEGSVFNRLGIWQTRQGPVRQAVSRLSARDFGDSFRALALIDQQSKGRAPGDPWQSLDRLLWSLCDPGSPRR